MGRPLGAKNVIPLEKRNVISSSATSSASPIATSNQNPLGQFLGLLTHQENFLKWIEARHKALSSISRTSAPAKRGPQGPKSATFRKYRQYAQQLAVLEAINGFEVFYKRTLIALGRAIQECVAPESIKEKIEARILWTHTGSISVADLVFEGQLFHDLEAVDKATRMLVGKGRYNPNQPSHDMKGHVRCIQMVFQMRHTLSHNAGLVTPSDATKFKVLGFQANAGELIDPSKDDFGRATFKLLEAEAQAFTGWLEKSAIAFLTECETSRGLKLPGQRKADLKALLGGTDAEWATVPWA